MSADICSITVGVVEGPARSGHGVFKGVCSNYLAAQPIGWHGVRLHPQAHYSVSPARQPAPPMIMVGPGTGVAPFRGFLQERAALKQKGVPVGESMLFFGCRDPLQDFLYEDELRAFEAAGVTRLFSAFSREPGKPKTYVQQAIKEHSEDVWRLLQQEAVILRLRRSLAHGAGRSAGLCRRVPAAHWHHGRRRAGLAHRTGGEPALSRGYLGLRDVTGWGTAKRPHSKITPASSSQPGGPMALWSIFCVARSSRTDLSTLVARALKIDQIADGGMPPTYETMY